LAVFENLSTRLQEAVNKMRGKGRVTEKDVKAMIREIKLALLEADVNYKVVKDFINVVSERAVGQSVLESLTPGQQIIKIVYEELIKLLGESPSKLTYSSKLPSTYMMVGLQGSGKTTTAGKLSNLIRKQGRNPMLVSCDVYRPAAIKQLEVIGTQLNIPVYMSEKEKSAEKIVLDSIEYAKLKQFDSVIIDTAGRLHIDEEMMDELKKIKQMVKPQEVLLVVDSMTGQDAVNAALSFDQKVGIDGIILSKLDGDTRGGAALSVKAVTGKPIKFVGVGEKLNDIEPFFPDRMASRILGMGDVLSLIEKAQEAYDEKQALELEKKLSAQQFTLDDFLEQMQQIKKMGPLEQIIGMIPGLNSKSMKNIQVDEKKMVYMEAIINSMTKKERANPSIINYSRRKRIAAGSGTNIQEVNRLLKDFDNMKKILKTLDSKGNFAIKKGGKFPINLQ